MDVREQSIKVDQARDRYREAQEDLRTSYEKNLNQMKETFDTKTEKQAKNYAEHKTKLEEQNQINNELYSEKTKNAITRGKEEFKNRLRENANRFEQETKESKNELNQKLSTISDSYKKSFDENNRYESQIKKSMGERYSNANKRYQEEFNTQIKNLDEKSKKTGISNREYDRAERIKLTNRHSNEMEELRNNAGEQKFKEVSRLRDDNENLRTTLERENVLLKDRQEARVDELIRMKGRESEEGQKNYEDLQKGIREKNLAAQEKQNLAHKKEAKEQEKRFNNDVRNIQSVANQKVKGGTQADNLVDELKQTKKSYENRLKSAQDELAKTGQVNSEKEEFIDTSYREKLKQMKESNVENLAKLESKNIETLNQANYKSREENGALLERYKLDTGNLRKEADDRTAHVSQQSGKKIKDQRIEFGRVVNTMTEKNMETINALKDDYSKDKTTYIERSKKDFNEEKVALKNEFNRNVNMRDTLYEQKLAEMEKQTTKIIENYENRISQIVRKAENEVESIKSTEEERKFKEGQANKVAIDNLQKKNEVELSQMRDKFERMIARDRITSEHQNNQIVQRYEDLLGRERIEHQKELSMRLSEAKAQFDRLYTSSELEKETLRSQYEQRMENMRLASLAQENSKKA